MSVTNKEVLGIPDGYELVRIGRVGPGELFVGINGEAREWDYSKMSENSNYVVVRKIEAPPEYEPYTFETMPLEGVRVREKANGYASVAKPYDEVKVIVSSEFCSFSELLNYWTHLDGTPCGTLVSGAAPTAASESEVSE